MTESNHTSKIFIFLSPAFVAQLHALIFQLFSTAPWLRALPPKHQDTTFQALEEVERPAHRRQSIPLCLPQAIDEQEPHPKVEEEYSSRY